MRPTTSCAQQERRQGQWWEPPRPPPTTPGGLLDAAPRGSPLAPGVPPNVRRPPTSQLRLMRLICSLGGRHRAAERHVVDHRVHACP